MNKNTISSLLAFISIFIFIVYAIFKIHGLLGLYEKSNLDFQSKMGKQIELIRTGGSVDNEKVANLMAVAASRDLENGIIKKQNDFLLFLLFMFSASTFGLIITNFLRMRKGDKGDKGQNI